MGTRSIVFITWLFVFLQKIFCPRKYESIEQQGNRTQNKTSQKIWKWKLQGKLKLKDAEKRKEKVWKKKANSFLKYESVYLEFKKPKGR